jgi:Fe-S cluster assembly protein SufD
MTIAVMKTKAETALAQQFAGDGQASATRKDAFAAFDKLGLPSRRVEEYKYTDLRARLTDAFQPAPSAGVPGAQTVGRAAHLASALAGVAATTVYVVNGRYYGTSPLASDVLAVQALTRATGAVAVVPVDPMAALTTALASDGVVITVAENAVITVPVNIIFATSLTAQGSVATRNVIRIGRNARVTIIESHVADGDAARQVHSLTDIHVGDGAHVTHIKIATAKPNETNLSSWYATLGAHANYRAFQFTASHGLTRNQLFVTFAGEHAKLDISGVMLGRASDHIDTTLVVDHAVPHCESRELFKIVLDDRARGIFQGKVIVRQHAQKSDGKQMANALMLSEDAEFDSKPELEIYADDVVCGHGATCAELDENLIFYCQSRGIPLPQARALLIESFIGEALEKIEHEAIRDALRAVALQWLAAKAV